MYDVESLDASASLIAQTIATAAVASLPMVLIAHSGPTELGDQGHSMCGIDWKSDAGGECAPQLSDTLADRYSKL